MTNGDKARVRWRQIFERDEFPLRACSTCLQHSEEQGKRWEQQRERERECFKMLKIFFYGIPKLWEFKEPIYFCPVPLICPAYFMTLRPTEEPFWKILDVKLSEYYWTDTFYMFNRNISIIGINCKTENCHKSNIVYHHLLYVQTTNVFKHHDDSRMFSVDRSFSCCDVTD